MEGLVLKKNPLGSLNQKFQERDNKRIRITVLRNEEKIKYEFYLEKKI